MDDNTDRRRHKRLQKKINKEELKVAKKMNVFENNGSFLDDFMKDLDQTSNGDIKNTCEEDLKEDFVELNNRETNLQEEKCSNSTDSFKEKEKSDKSSDNNNGDISNKDDKEENIEDSALNKRNFENFSK